MALITATAGFFRAFRNAYARKWTFLATFFVVFLVSLFVLARLDLLPEMKRVAEADTMRERELKPMVSLSASPLIADVVEVVYGGEELPERIEIPAIHLSATIENPMTTDVKALDTALLSGPIRYPTSAKLGGEGNVVLFGHSSYLPIVHNQAFKVFNGIQNLTPNDTITVYSKDTAYVYTVGEVTKADAEDDAIPLLVTGRTLTLSTCDSFGEKTDRFIVVATLTDTRPLLK